MDVEVVVEHHVEAEEAELREAQRQSSYVFSRSLYCKFSNMTRNPIAMEVSSLPVERKTCW